MKQDQQVGHSLGWSERLDVPPIKSLPQIFYSDGTPFMAANAYAKEKAELGSRSETILSTMYHLAAYLSWLEERDLDWTHFPLKKRERCLYRYRGYLIEQRDDGEISSSTASARMSAIVRFYRWAMAYGWIERKPYSYWQERNVSLQFTTPVGLSRTFSVSSTDLSIPNRKRTGNTLENGLTPLQPKDRRKLLIFLKSNKMIELYLMFLLGFYTGARIETIRTLRIQSLETLIPDLTSDRLFRLPVGPPTPVKTKFNVSGSLLVPEMVIDELKSYAKSARRLVRQSKAIEDEKTLLFLTVTGAKYHSNTFNSLMTKFRRKIGEAGYVEFYDLKFHQTRATFGTELMKSCLASNRESVENAIGFVKDAMLHQDEKTTWKYIKFIESEKFKEQLSDEFFAFFTGQEEDERLLEEITYG